MTVDGNRDRICRLQFAHMSLQAHPTESDAVATVVGIETPLKQLCGICLMRHQLKRMFRTNIQNVLVVESR